MHNRHCIHFRIYSLKKLWVQLVKVQVKFVCNFFTYQGPRVGPICSYFVIFESNFILHHIMILLFYYYEVSII